MIPGPKVTVAIATCCNRSRLLCEALQSVLGQTLRDIEIYVSNNGSTDDTPAVVASFGDPRVQYVALAQPGGPHANFNHCLRLGTAPFIAICQDDDFWLPNNLEVLVEVLERRPDVALAHGAFRLVDADGRVLEERVAWGGLTANRLESGDAFIRRSMSGVNPVNMSSALMRRDVLVDEEFRIEDDVLCDLGMWLRLARRGDIAFVSEPLTARRVHRQTMSAATGINEPEHRRSTFRQVRLAQDVKERFLGEVPYRRRERWQLRRLSRRWARGALLRILIRKTLPERSRPATLRLMWQAARIEPTVLSAPRAWRLVLASLAGQRGRRLARRVIGPARPIGLR